MKIMLTGTDKENENVKRIVLGRDKFIGEYCKKNGWSVDITTLTIDQIIEIRSHEGWKNPK